MAIANTGERRILWIGLDGLDEQFPRLRDLGWLIQTAKERDDLCLILCFRTESRPRVRNRLYPTDNGYEYDFANDPHVAEISVPDFSNDELLDAVKEGIDIEAHERIALTLNNS